MSEADDTNFYFLVKECGISPLDIPHMTPLQKDVLIKMHNRIVKKQEEELKEAEKQARLNARRGRYSRSYPRRRR